MSLGSPPPVPFNFTKRKNLPVDRKGGCITTPNGNIRRVLSTQTLVSSSNMKRIFYLLCLTSIRVSLYNYLSWTHPSYYVLTVTTGVKLCATLPSDSCDTVVFTLVVCIHERI